MSDDNLQPVADPLKGVSCASATDVGLRREENQDSFTVIETEKFKFFIVADGMGGVKGGAIASNLAITTVRAKLEGVSEITPELLASSVHDANEAIFAHGSADPTYAGMGTTLVGLFFMGTQLYILNVGDSRAYRFRGELARQLSEDHTLVRELVRSGAITEAQAKNHPVSHMLTRSLGPTPEVEVDCAEMIDGPARGDRYLLCSDGLYNLVHPREMFEIIRDNPPSDAVTRLVALANARGGTDNITVIVITVDATYPRGVEDYSVVESPHDIYVGAQPPPPPADGPGQSVTEPPIDDGVGESTSTSGASEGELGELPTMEESPAYLPPSPHRAFSLRTALFAVFAIGIGIGMFSGDIFRPALPSDASQTANPNPLSAEVAPLRSTLSLQEYYPAPLLDEGSFRVAVAGQTPVEGKNGQGALEVSSSEAEVIQRRKEVLRSRIELLGQRIDAFDRPLTGAMGAEGPSTIEMAKVKAERGALDVELNTETRKLALWVGRKKRLDAMDPVDLASEVAVSSEEVRRSKDLFEKASWEFLKEVEVYRYNPNDEGLKEKIAGLALIRNQRIDDLRQQVRAAVDSELGKSNQRISELSSRRDDLQEQARGVEQDSDFYKILMGSDEAAKKRRKQDLSREREIAIAELSELTRIVPDPAR